MTLQGISRVLISGKAQTMELYVRHTAERRELANLDTTMWLRLADKKLLIDT